MERSSRPSTRITPVRTGTRCPERSEHQGGTRSCLEVEQDALEPALRRLAAAAVAIRAGGTVLDGVDDIPTAQRRALPTWRLRREVFSDLELLVLQYAEAATATPPLVAGELTSALIERLGHRQLVELTAVVAMETVRARLENIDHVAGEVGGECEIASTP